MQQNNVVLTIETDETKERFDPYGSFGRDEMNFAEFPIAALGKRRPGQNTLTFSDTVHGENGNLFPRTLTITASDAWGLPMSADDEVILGLIQIAAKDEFKSREVYFTRYDLIKSLGWSKSKFTYLRIEESLNRWKGLTLRYDKAWWCDLRKCWISETFSLIDNVTLCDNERRFIDKRLFPQDPSAGLSCVSWNKIILSSFQSANVKSLNFEFYKDLETPLSKRMFRFLDKRLYKPAPLKINVRSFACEHIGMSQSYDNTNLKRKLLPAITELEQKGFLAPLPPSERFKQLQRGKWEVTFTRAAEKKVEPIVVTPKKETLTNDAAPKRGRPRKSETRQQNLFIHPVPSGLPKSVVERRSYTRTERDEMAFEEGQQMLAKLGLRKRAPESA